MVRKRIIGLMLALAAAIGVAAVVTVIFAPQLMHTAEIEIVCFGVETSPDELTVTELEMLTNEEIANLLIPFEEAKANAGRPELMLLTDGLYGDEWRINAIELILGGIEHYVDSVVVHVAMLELQDKTLTLGTAIWDAYLQGLIDPPDAVALGLEINRLASVDFEEAFEAFTDESISSRRNFHSVGMIEGLYAAFNDTDLDSFIKEIAAELLAEME